LTRRVSRTPIREAIRQLEAIGFVEARPHRGAVVPHFTPEKLDEMFLVMAEMEALCAYYASLNIEPRERTILEKAHVACRAAALGNDVNAYYARNIAFHDAIYRSSHNAFLVEVTLGVRNRVAPFRKLQFQTRGRLERSVVEHERILNAILSGDAALAASLMREHLRLVRSSVGEVSPALRDPVSGAARPADELRQPTSG
jgi:DNA-binding GntR family transcriptional regulator